MKKETVNFMNHVVETTDKKGNPMRIKISLADECKNGHNDFHITGDVWEKDKRRNERSLIMSCSIGGYIAKSHPKYQIFEDLHGHDFKGSPMYPQENGFYHLKNGEKDYLIRSYLFTETEYELIKANAEDELYFRYLMESFGIVQRWQEKANKAIELLEKWTGQKFEDNSVKSNYTPLTVEELSTIGKRINEGYYTPEAIAQRQEQKIRDEQQKEFDKIKEQRDKIIEKANVEYEIDFQILQSGLKLDNFIYYNHTNTGVFNWQESSYRSKCTEEQFNYFMSVADFTKMPTGIKFELKNQ